MKLVEARTNREYVDEAKAADILILYGLNEEHIYTRKIFVANPSGRGSAERAQCRRRWPTRPWSGM